MKLQIGGGARVHAGVVLFVCTLPLLSLSAAACGGASPGPNGGPEHDSFTAATNDEYTEVLTNAVIGTPAGVITVDAKGVVSAPVPVSTGGVAASDAGQATGASPPSDAGSSFDDAGAPPPTGDDAGASSDDGGSSPLPDGGVGASSSFGQWHFDDCSPRSHFLLDSSGAGANAQQALNAACVPGISGLGVQFRTAKDIVQVPDEPQFIVASNVAVAAWVHPNTVAGDQPIVLKRLNNKTSFSLGIHKGNIEMSVVLANGETVISRAPVAAGTWSHVAGLYDGTFLFLFINGQQFGQVFAGSALADVFAPVRIGATTQSQHFDGIIDEVFLTMQPISKDVLTALACISRPTTIAVNPLTSGPVPFDTTVHYDIAVKDNDVGFCPATNYEAFNNGASDVGITANFSPFFVSNVAPGATAAFGADVTGSDSADPGVHRVPFTVVRFGQTFEQLFGQLTYELAVPTGCFVSTRHEIMITDVSVVDDPVRTFGVTDPGLDGGVGFADASSGSSSSSGGSVGFGSSSSSGSSGGGFASSGGPVPTPVPPPVCPVRWRRAPCCRRSIRRASVSGRSATCSATWHRRRPMRPPSPRSCSTTGLPTRT